MPNLVVLRQTVPAYVTYGGTPGKMDPSRRAFQGHSVIGNYTGRSATYIQEDSLV